MLYQDRVHAGKVLAERLQPFADREDAVVLALPRGGVPVAYQIAQRLKAPLDVFIVRKLGVPGHEELAMGAIASGGAHVMNEGIIRNLGISDTAINAVIEMESAELTRREQAYRSNRQPHQLNDKQVILVDDGLATGATMRAAIRAVRTYHPKEIIVAVPVADAEIVGELRREVDDVFCPETPTPFHGVGQWYKDFGQTSDEEVTDLLTSAKQLESNGAPYAPPQFKYPTVSAYDTDAT